MCFLSNPPGTWIKIKQGWVCKKTKKKRNIGFMTEHFWIDGNMLSFSLVLTPLTFLLKFLFWWIFMACLIFFCQIAKAMQICRHLFACSSSKSNLFLDFWTFNFFYIRSKLKKLMSTGLILFFFFCFISKHVPTFIALTVS